MSITPLPTRPARLRPRHVGNGLRQRRPTTAIASDDNSLTVTFEVTLTGDERHRDAANILDTLRRVTQRLAAARVGLRPPLSTASHPPTVDTETPPAPDRIQVIDAAREVRRGGQSIPFTRLEFDLLSFLARHPRQVFSREQLLERVWGFGHAGHRTVDVHIRRLRSKLPDREVVTTIRGVGYRLADDADIDIVLQD